MTPEEAQAAIDHLENNRMAWQRGNSHIFNHFGARFAAEFLQVARSDSTFFQATRAHHVMRLYCWGGMGKFNQFPFSTLLNLPPVLASQDAYDDAFPGESTGVAFTNAQFNIDEIPSAVDLHVPNTEEFVDTAVPVNPLPNVVSIAAIQLSLPNESFFIAVGTFRHPCVLACTSDGALYTAGHDILRGLGSDTFRFSQTALQRVYGDEPSFASVKFIKVQSSVRAFFALDDEGHIWMTGDVQHFAAAASFPENSTDLTHYRKAVVSEYYDKTATLISDELLFTDFWVGRRSLLAMTADGRMFGLGNNFNNGKLVNTRIFHEVGGFVDTITITNEGNTFTGATGQAQYQSLTFSAPSDPYGETATGAALIQGSGSNSKLKGIVITNPGWGYTSPPTITFNRGAGSPPAGFEEGQAECTIYTGTWKHAAVAGGVNASSGSSLFFDQYAAVSQDGVVYSWGAVSDYSVGTSGANITLGPKRMIGRQTVDNPSGTPQPASYEKVFAGRLGANATGGSVNGRRSFGIALDADGKASFWGNPATALPVTSAPFPLCITPTLAQSANALTLLSSADATLGAYSYVDCACAKSTVALVRDDHVVFTYGGIGHRFFNSANQPINRNAWYASAASLAQGKDTYNDDGNGASGLDGFEGVGGFMRKMRPIMGSAKFTRVFAVDESGFFGGFYAVREPEELDPMYGTRINPLPPYRNPLTATRGPCSEALLEWEVTEPSHGGHPIFEFRIEYRLIGAITSTTLVTPLNTWATFSTVGPTVRSATITGLGRVGYQFRVSARDSDNGNLFAFETSDGFALGPPTDLTFTRDPCDQVQLSWTPPVQAECVVVANYRLEYRAGISGTFLVFGTVAGTETTGTVTGLDPTLRYQFRVARVADAGPDLFSNTVTSGSVPATPSGVAAALGTGPGEVDVTWNAAESQLCFPNTDYRVQFRPSTTSTWSTFARAPSTDKFATVTGLTAGVTYFFRVRATNTVGNSSDSAQSNSVTV